MRSSGSRFPRRKARTAEFRRRRVGRGLIKRGAGGDDDVRAFVALDAVQKRKSLGGDFRVGQNIFDRGEFGFRKEKRVRQPVEQTFVK